MLGPHHFWVLWRLFKGYKRRNSISNFTHQTSESGRKELPFKFTRSSNFFETDATRYFCNEALFPILILSITTYWFHYCHKISRCIVYIRDQQIIACNNCYIFSYIFIYTFPIIIIYYYYYYYYYLLLLLLLLLLSS